MSGIVKTIIDLIFQPGSSVKLIPVINGSLFLLLMLLFWIWKNDVIDSIHVYVMGTLSMCLMASVSFAGHEYAKIVAQNKDSDGKASESTSSSSDTKKTE
jgi:hypothetical protein